MSVEAFENYEFRLNQPKKLSSFVYKQKIMKRRQLPHHAKVVTKKTVSTTNNRSDMNSSMFKD